MTHTPLKIALVTDIHNGPDLATKKGLKAMDLLRDFCSAAADWDADILVDMGDRYSDIDRDQDLHYLRQVARAFKAIDLPRGHIMGNHDQENLGPDDHARVLETDMASRVVRLKNIALVFWQANTRNFWPHGLNLLQTDLDWLAATLSRTSGPCIVFTHVPLDSGAMTGHHYFEKNPGHAGYPEARQARKIMERSKKVILCVAGHVHWNTFNQINGIPYLSLHSLTESFTTPPDPSGAWAFLEIGERIDWTVYGKDSLHLTLPLPTRPGGWLPPLQPGFIPRKTGPKRLDNIRSVLFDLDGVFYRGQQVMQGGTKVIEWLDSQGIPYLAITNNSLFRPGEISARLATMGIRIPGDRILTSGQAVARALAGKESCPSAHILGSWALKETLAEAGVTASDNPDYVIAGWHQEFSCQSLKVAVSLLLNGAKLIGTNPDPLVPAGEGIEPENGALLAFLERASGKKARILGKPDPGIFNMALELLKTTPEETLMVGDNLDTDILGATCLGMKTVYIDGGILPSVSTVRPTRTVQALDQVLELLIRSRSHGTSGDPCRSGTEPDK